MRKDLVTQDIKEFYAVIALLAIQYLALLLVIYAQTSLKMVSE